VFKTTQPELHTAGEVINVTEMGVGPAVKSVFAKIEASGVLKSVAGGAK